jgi:hypothetical protein
MGGNPATIKDHIIIQERPFIYPATIKDLWLPNQKTWNANLINTLFTTEIANDILQTPIVNAVGQDTLIWKLTPAGKFSSKSAYKHCFINLDLPARHQPKTVHPQTIALLNQVWQDKHMTPRVQTFSWRLLRKAPPTGKRASKFSMHIQENCSRCDNTDDEMHMLFLCPYSKAAWFCSPLFIKTEILIANNDSIPDMIQTLLNSGHPQIDLNSLYTFLWCLWKSRNNALFAKKYCRPSQVFAAANAIIQATKLEGGSPAEDHSVTRLQDHRHRRYKIQILLQATQFFVMLRGKFNQATLLNRRESESSLKFKIISTSSNFTSRQCRLRILLLSRSRLLFLCSR